MTEPGIRGRIREAADGLRGRKSTQALKEAQTRLAQEAAARRQQRKEENARGKKRRI